MWNPNLIMTRDQMRDYDRRAIEEIGIKGPVLMENAGRGAADLIDAACPAGQRVLILAGPGNNGGDGFVIARHLINRGRHVETHIAIAEDRIAGDARTNLDILCAMAGSVHDLTTEEAAARLPLLLEHAGVVVDALLGTGVTRDVEGHLARVIEAMNSSSTPIIAIDLPSGLDADTGRPHAVAVHASRTATFGHLKRGLVIYPGADLAGRVTVIPIGVPDGVSMAAGHDGELVDEARARAILGRRTTKRDAHKGTFGHLLVLAGSVGKTGAAALVGEAAMRVGTGLVTIATTNEAQPLVEAKCLEVMVEPIIADATAPLSGDVVARLKQLLANKRAVAIGPGLTTAPGIGSVALRLLREAKVPTVIDADGLNILAAEPDAARDATAPLVLTPHPGEMARLLESDVQQIEEDRFESAREAARRYRATVVLKGAHSIIATPEGELFVNPSGNPGMASGGVGDALTGIVGGLLAQGFPPLDAALLGVFLHGRAGDVAASQVGEIGLVASDLVHALPDILEDWSA